MSRRRRPDCRDTLYGYAPTDVIRIGDPGRPGTPGKQGPPGRDGDPGSPGLSAYEVALENGFVGTEEEWLESLKGEPGSGGGDLPDLENTGEGLSPVKIYTRDNKGRIVGDEDASTDDLPEGSNLYFTEQRARDASVADEIDPLVTDVAPSQRAVAEALESVVISSEIPEDGDILEFASMSGAWVPKKDPRQLLIDGGNF